ncbi:MAG: DUF192 domain-containing protein [Bdellovibrionales bacterium]|nr:DUF192 domain-containing protein [Bdellovibrionales bacterium]
MRAARVLRKEDQQVVAESCAVTENAWERMKGLLGRKGMERGEALWISPCVAVHTFFMKFPIDVVFLGATGKVLAVVEGMKPWRHSALHLSAAGVLELPGGRCAEMDIHPGDTLEVAPWR